MGFAVVNGAICKCAMGTAPSSLTVTPEKSAMAGNQPIANIMDNVPMKNVMPFGTCSVLTAAASGTPTPCVPATVAPWSPGCPTVYLNHMPVLNDSSVLACTIGGVISITYAGQSVVQVP